MSLSPHGVTLFEDSRARLEAIAYRLLGSAGAMPVRRQAIG